MRLCGKGEKVFFLQKHKAHYTLQATQTRTGNQKQSLHWHHSFVLESVQDGSSKRQVGVWPPAFGRLMRRSDRTKPLHVTQTTIAFQLVM